MDSERIEQIYTEIEKYSIELNSDIAALGPKHLSDLIYTCRNYTNSVSRIILEISRDKRRTASLLSAAEAAYAVASADLLANDRSVKDLPSIEDRRATIAVMLHDNVQIITELKAGLQNLDFIDKAVRHRHRELKDTMAEIRVQRSLIRDELDTKSFYGDESSTIRENAGASKGSALGIDAEELDNLFQETMQEIASDASSDAPAKTTPSIEPVAFVETTSSDASVETPKPVSVTAKPVVAVIAAPEAKQEPSKSAAEDISFDDELAQIDAFLASPAPSKKTEEDFDLSSILASV